MLNKLRWYAARLQLMTPREMAWRTQSAARIPLDFLKKDGTGAAPNISDWWRLNHYPFALRDERESIEKVPLFDLEFPADTAFDWHTDYRHEKTVARSFASSLDIRDTQVVGDIKYIWEINRHQHLSAIAYSDRTDAAKIITHALRSWMDANPYLRGVNWTSSLELGLRLMSWALLMPAIRGSLAEDPSFRDALAGQVYLHLRRIRQKLSLFSSANNHLIGELCGLYVGSACFPWWPETPEWRSTALAMLDREVALQYAPDGVNREQAFSYQLFTLEMLFLAWATAVRVGDSVPPSFPERLRKALEFTAAVATDKGDLPMYGDSDDARGFLLSYKDSQLKTVLDVGARLLGDSSFAGHLVEDTVAGAILAPQAQKAPVEAPPQRACGMHVFPEGGYIAVASQSSRLLADFGPLGYTDIAAHGHADALSLWLAVDDEYLLVDAGTYAYHSHQDWRRYFRSTAAHNTVEIDGLDQSTMAGRFLWSQKASAALLDHHQSDDAVAFRMEHDGYLRLADPVRHEREVHFVPAATELRVTDRIHCRGAHKVAAHWHFHPEAQVVVDRNRAEIRFRSKRLVLNCDGEGFTLDAGRGSESPLLGWHSARFNEKSPAWTLRYSGVIKGACSIQTVLRDVAALPPVQDFETAAGGRAKR